MKLYAVGGAIRDDLLGLPVQDIDYVVTGATPQQMLAQGFTPVGKDFPVFLHPKTHQEYALARTERKIAQGYHGFTFYATPEVSLEQDLARRDLTINAMARKILPNGLWDSQLIDPYQGKHDLKQGVLRHIQENFSEDPLRILRCARFAARFHHFTISAETEKLMRTMVDQGEIRALSTERIWQELLKGLMQTRPSLMFHTLYHCGALSTILPEATCLFEKVFDKNQLDASTPLALLDYQSHRTFDAAERFALLLLHLFREKVLSLKRIVPLSQHLKIPSKFRELARLCVQHYDLFTENNLSASSVLHFLKINDAFRQTARFASLLKVYTLLHPQQQTYAYYLLAALKAAQQINGKIIQQDHPADEMRLAIQQARIKEIEALNKERLRR